MKKGGAAAVIVEGIQGIGGIHIPDKHFIDELGKFTKKYESLLILDEIQSGYGRSGKFFAHQYFDVQPDLITMAKGMGNGFPIGGVLIHPEINPWHGNAWNYFWWKSSGLCSRYCSSRCDSIGRILFRMRKKWEII